MSDASPTPPPKPVEKAPEAEPAPLPLGNVAQYLADKGVALEALAPDAKGTETFLLTNAAQVQHACTMLRDEETLTFDLLLSATAVDALTHRKTVYHLYSTARAAFVALVINADANEVAPSLKPVWHAADWHEREGYDLMGIIYQGHDDLRRILMPDYWQGFPLRKNYQDNDPRLVWNRR